MSDTERKNMPEAPASATARVKSKNGFSWLFTLRGTSGTELVGMLEKFEADMINREWTPVEDAPRGGFKKPVEYVEGRTCPTDGAKLVYATKQDGSKFIKCENQRWNKMLKRPEGCTFVEWPNAQGQNREAYQGDY